MVYYTSILLDDSHIEKKKKVFPRIRAIYEEQKGEFRSHALLLTSHKWN
jgi:hypothetical protein